MMRTTWIARLASVGLAFTSARALAQPPAELPVLDPPSGGLSSQNSDTPPSPRICEPYDSSQFYLPDYVPSSPKPLECPCGPPGQFWAIPEYLYWATRGESRPAFLPGSGGDSRFGSGLRPGFRIQTGAWLDHDHDWGVDGNFFFLQSGQRTDPLVVPPGVGLDAIGLPSVRVNSATASTSTDLLGAEANARRTLLCDRDFRFEALAGYRFLKLDESLSTAADFTPLGSLAAQVTTRNQFHGGQVGLFGELRYGRAYLNLIGKLALGATHEIVELQPVGVRRTFTDLAVLPETSAAVGLQLSDRCRASVGYNFLYVSKVARPSDQLLGGTSDFWAQGVNLGLEMRY